MYKVYTPQPCEKKYFFLLRNGKSFLEVFAKVLPGDKLKFLLLQVAGLTKQSIVELGELGILWVVQKANMSFAIPQKNKWVHCQNFVDA